MGNIREMVGQGGRDWTHPIECRGIELAAVIAEGKASGYHCHRMRVLPDVIYELQFWALPDARDDRPKIVKESLFNEAEARRLSSASGLYGLNFNII